ncbi:MAG: glycosyltransferase [Acidobacteriia bacterium]|nr:glycosyltransferase [Terriglobia bacterium]
MIEDCLESLAKMAPEITPIVVDNASLDATVARSAPAQVIANRENRGFAAAANQGIAATDADFILLLNPDVKLLTSVDALREASSRYGIASGKLVDESGEPQRGFTIRRFPTPAALIFELFGINRLWSSNPVNRSYRYLDRPLDQPGPVEQPAGAFLMIRRDVWKKLGGFDEGFHPIWFEDVDFCRRAADMGFGIAYVPQESASHSGAHSIRQVSAGCRAWYWCVSLLRYAAKHFRNPGYRAVCAAVLVTSIPRMFAGIIRERSISPIAVYCKIAWFAGLCLVSSTARGMAQVRTS